MDKLVKENYVKRLNSIKQRNAILLAKYKDLTNPKEKEALSRIINQEANVFFELKAEYERELLKDMKPPEEVIDLIASSSEKKSSSIIPFIAVCAALGITIGVGANHIKNNSSTSTVPAASISEENIDGSNESFSNQEQLDERDIYNKTYHSDNGKSFKYDVYYPRESGDSSLIVYLHGAGGGYPDNTYSLPRMINNNEVSCSSTVLVPKTASGTKSNTFGGSANMRVSLMELINKVVSEENIDPNKIILIGHSYGADAVIRMASEFPNTFSCVVPISAEADKGYDLYSLTTTNLLLYCGSREGTLSRNMSSLAQGVNYNNGNAVFETCEGKGHMNVCSYLFGETNLLNRVTEFSLNNIKL